MRVVWLLWSAWMGCYDRLFPTRTRSQSSTERAPATTFRWSLRARAPTALPRRAAPPCLRRPRGAARGRDDPRAENQDEGESNERDAREDPAGHRGRAGGPVHEGHATEGDVRELDAGAGSAAPCGRAGDDRRHPARRADPPGALGALGLADDPADLH